MDVLRLLNFVGATGKARAETRDGRAYTVVPVIALMEGVIRAMNSPEPEFVPAACFEAAPAEWDGVPLQPGHPLVDGAPVSGQTAEALKTAFGHVEGTKAGKKKLTMEAWIDDERARANPKSARVLERVLANEVVEVSVGAFVSTTRGEGTHGGRAYRAAWARMKPDHLAMLGDDQIGACSIAMGCGAMRVNQMTIDAMTELEGEEQIRAAGFNPDQPRDENGQWTGGFGIGTKVTVHPKGEHGRTPEHGVVIGHVSAKKVVRVKHVGGGTFDWSPESLRNAMGDGSNQHAIRYTGAAGTYDVRPEGDLHSVYCDGNKVSTHASKDKAHEWADRLSKGTTMRQLVGRFLSFVRHSSTTEPDLDLGAMTAEMRAAMPAGWSDRDVQEALRKALQVAETGARYLYVVAVYNDNVVYSVPMPPVEAGPDSYVEKMYSRPFTFVKETASYTLGERAEVEPVMTYEPVMKAAMSDSGQPTPPCQCGGHRPTTLSKGADMDKKERIAALVANPHSAIRDAAVLDTLGDPALKALEDGATAAKTKIDADALVLKTAQDAATAAQAEATALRAAAKPAFKLEDAPQEIRDLVASSLAAGKAEKDGLVATLKAAQATFTEAQLSAKDIPELRQLAEFIKVPVAPIDYSLGGVPGIRAAASATAFGEKEGMPPDPYAKK